MPIFTNNITITRRVSVNSAGAVVISAVEGSPEFEVELTPPRPKVVRRPGAPQEVGAYTLRYWKSPVAFYIDSLQAGDRFFSKATEWEVLVDASGELLGMQAGIQTTQALPLDVLYPFTMQLQEVGGQLVREDVKVGLWDPDERHQDSGTYRDYDGQAGIEHADVLQANRQLVIGDNTYKIITSEMDLISKRVNLSLRRAGLRAA